MDNNIQEQINDINHKLDIVLDEVIAQKQTRQSIEDLTADLTLIGTDIFSSTVTELDNAGVEVDGEAVKLLILKLIRNIDTITELFEMLESGKDLLKDLSPIIQQVGLDGMHLMNDIEKKGYFDFFREAIRILDNIVTHFGAEDMKLLADNIVTIMETVKSLTQPEMLKAINSALIVYKSIDVENIEEYSLFKAMKAMNSKEMRKGIGFMITFLKNISKATDEQQNQI
ncbi:MAG: DUF1641 domain-containing protein [Lentimicrobiaceae bacterium]|jgi:uncharacterized protein YjgD (DUF1641 family)|nr:DUF1641 domain-containing protein [Lentimicrobiaceae bacterium]MCP4910632.1 DUF1641 domain-containing protein [Bacteroidota bacterium]MBT3454865.1 DUF1641 domain-containing protein [Lentimicrobiaceae bacterium]MBT3818509.1 DUF1641 domain-containing protein [Lentimicrobiaceae bacterium]MBT4060876.1 DUF1641 domain-containing protein [Lentimicrobiaceae bacterium]